MTLSSIEREYLFPVLKYEAYIDEGYGCWLSKGKKWSDGYGYFRFRYKPVHIHRVAYAVFIGDFDDNLCVLHRCDVRHCYNPEHLFLGTRADNMADKVAKGRQAKGQKGGMFGRTGEKCPVFGKGYLRAGEKNGRAKLREHQIREILGKHEAGLSNREIAEEYGVSRMTINYIIIGRRWKRFSQSKRIG